MKRRGRLAVLVAFGIAAAGLVFWQMHRGPRYQGKGLLEWLEIAHDNAEGSTERQSAFVAIQHIGTNALPYLVNAVKQDPAKARRGIPSFVRSVPSALGGELLRRFLGDRWDDRRSDLAQYGFRALGPIAEPAVPELAGMITPTNPQIWYHAMAALAEMGDPGIPPLLAVLRDRRHPGRIAAVVWIIQAYRHAHRIDDALPVIGECLRDKDPVVVNNAINSLGVSALKPDFAVPTFTELTTHSNAGVRYTAVAILSRYGKDAIPAVPALVESLADPDSLVRHAATNTLRKIAPEVLETNRVMDVHE